MPGWSAFWRKLVRLFARPPRDAGELERAALADGTRILIRPLVPADAPVVAEALAHLSEESRYQRFLAPVDRLTPEQLEYLTCVDGADHIALGAAVPAGRFGALRPIAIARSIRDRIRPEEAEVAIVVADDFHRRGVGTLLLDRLALRAYDHGIRRWRAVMLATNQPARAVLRRVAEEIAAVPDGPTVEVTYELRPPAGPATAVQGRPEARDRRREGPSGPAR